MWLFHMLRSYIRQKICAKLKNVHQFYAYGFLSEKIQVG